LGDEGFTEFGVGVLVLVGKDGGVGGHAVLQRVELRYGFA
jgi:hypothetical protein